MRFPARGRAVSVDYRPTRTARRHAELGYEIVHPLSTEAWGLRRFFVRAPDGNVINIVNRRD